MPAFADVLFNITNIRVASMFADGSYATTSYSLTYGSKLSFSLMTDTDQLKAYGMIAELLSVVTHIEGDLEQAAIDSDGLFAMTATSTVTSGANPNRQADIDMLAGGAGMPYFGAIGEFAGLYGSGALVGLRKCQLDTPPGWVIDQNKFRLSAVKFKAIAPDLSNRKLHRIRRYETFTTIPTNFNTFFA